MHGKDASQALREQAAAGWQAFRSYGEPGGIRDELTATAARFPGLAKVETLGFGLEGLAPAARDDLVARSLTHLTGAPRR